MTAISIPAPTVRPVARAAKQTQMGRLEKRYAKEKETVVLRRALMWIFKRHTETDAIADQATIQVCVDALGITADMLSQKQQSKLPDADVGAEADSGCDD